MHAHALDTMEAASALGLPISAIETEFGTPSDHEAFLELLRSHPYPRHRAWIRKGHGFFVLGPDARSAIDLASDLVRRAPGAD